jgi:hypothetical protein
MNYKLCYVKGAWAYFTNKEIKDQWGDDWNDAPYEHNAGEPYKPCWHNEPEHIAKRGKTCQCEICKRDWNDDGSPKWRILKVAFDGNFSAPCETRYNSPYSVEAINAKAIAWLMGNDAVSNATVAIHAGVSPSEFIDTIERCGGRVYRS